MDLQIETKKKKKWTLDRVRKKLSKAGLSEAGEKISDGSFEELLILKTAFNNTVTIGFAADEDGDLTASGLGFNYGKPPAASTAGWYPISAERNSKEFEAMQKFAELIGGVPVYWRVTINENRGM